MKYMGSKSRFVNELLQIILKDRNENQNYIEPFAGGMNVISNVKGKRIANDIHYYLIEMWKALSCGWIPEKITKEEYLNIRKNKNNYPAHIVGWAGFNCSYSGKWFGGFAGETKTKIGTIRDYQNEALNNVLKQVDGMTGVLFQNKTFLELEIPNNSIIYCDPPYKGTTKYDNDFNHDIFWEWVRNISNQGHSVFVSEYNAPPDFKPIWEREAKSSLSANGVTGGNKISIEKLFVIN